MTTVTYRDGIMAADSRAYSGDKHPIGQKDKLYRIESGAMIGCSSSVVGAPTLFVEFLKTFGEHLDCRTAICEEAHGVQALVVQKNGEVFYWNDGVAFTGPLEGDFFAIGSGEAYAYGAMMMGATAIQAINVAKEVDPYTGGETRALTHHVD